MNVSNLKSKRKLAGKFAVVTITAGSIFLSGCANMGQDANLSPDQQRLRDQKQEYNLTVAEGAAAGAVAGALLGGLLGGGRGALIGSVAGLGAGAMAGDYVANMKEKYANAEDRAQAEIAAVAESNAKIAAELTTIEKVVAQDKIVLAGLQQTAQASAEQLAAAKSKLALARQDRALIASELSKMNTARDTATSALADVQKSGSGPKAAQLKNSIDDMAAKIKKVEAQLAELDNAIAVSKVS